MGPDGYGASTISTMMARTGMRRIATISVLIKQQISSACNVVLNIKEAGLSEYSEALLFYTLMFVVFTNM